MNNHLRVDHVYAVARPTKYGTLYFESYEKFKVFSFDYMQVLSDDAFVGLTSYISEKEGTSVPPNLRGTSFVSIHLKHCTRTIGTGEILKVFHEKAPHLELVDFARHP